MSGSKPAKSISTESLVLLAVVALAWGGHWAFIKIALGEIPPFTFRALGLLVGGASLLAIVWIQRGSLRLPREDRWPVVVAALLNVTGFHITSAFALLVLGVGQAIIFAYSYPVWTVLLARIVLGERITPTRLIGMGLGLGAIALLFGPAAASGEGAMLGIFLMLMTAFFWAAGSVYYKTRRWIMTSIEMAGWQLLIGGVPIVICAAIFESPPSPFGLSDEVLGSVAFSLIMAMALGHWAWFRALGSISAPIAALVSLVNPVVGIYVGAWLLAEDIGSRELGALALIMASLLVVVVGPGTLKQLSRLRARSSSSRPSDG